MKIKSLCVALAVSVLLMFGGMPVTALAIGGSGTIIESGTYKISDYRVYSDLMIVPGLTVTLVGEGTEATTPKIRCGQDTKLTLDNVLLNTSASSGRCALTFLGTGCTLIASGTNSFRSGNFKAGICVETGAELQIQGNTGSTLTAIGGQGGAGIGGNDGLDGGGNDSGVIKIVSGTIITEGGVAGAGIGGGVERNNGTLLITGGTVTATAGARAAGIGGGEGGNGGTITISGGNVTSTSDTLGAGIGGGEDGNAGTITITGGTVDSRAVSSSSSGDATGAGIGNGHSGASDSGTVTITGGTVYAESGMAGAGIGGAYLSAIHNVTISGGNVTAKSLFGGSGIGGATQAPCGTVEITGGIVTAYGGVANPTTHLTSGAGIGGGGGIVGVSSGSAAGIINISGGKVYAKMGSNVDRSAGTSSDYDLGPGSDGSGGTITLSGTASVFLENDAAYQPILKSIEHLSHVDLSSGSIRGITVENAWKTATGAYLQKAVTPTPTPSIPKTGEDITNLYWFAGLAVASLVGIALLLLSKKKAHTH